MMTARSPSCGRGWRLRVRLPALSPTVIVIVTMFSTLAAVLHQARAETCPNLCSGHGRCDRPSKACECYDGYTGGDCSLRSCPTGPAWTDLASGTDLAHQEAECSNRGVCDRSTGACVCESDRFEGEACERRSCPSDCNFVGVCKSMQHLAADKNPGLGSVYTYDSVWDADMMYGCVCDTGYSGADCSERTCPSGDDPLTGTTSDPAGVQRNEKQVVACRATSGTFTLAFRGQTTANIAYDASEDELRVALSELTTISNAYETALTVTYSTSGSSACLAGGNTITIEFLQDFGSLPLLVADSTNLNHISASGVSLTVDEIADGTKEDADCSNRGVCDAETGTCTCSTNYDTSDGYGNAGQRGDCGYAAAAITVCPGDIECSGHGICEGAPTYACSCSDGWQGGDCSEMVCPFGRSWFDLPVADEQAHTSLAECSDMGVCDRSTGDCVCMDGYEGGACERVSCPAGDGHEAICSSNGECRSMAELAELADVNGDATNYTYGATPNDPLTWDASRMYGCLCDDGYTGYDCSLHMCPYGDDPLTANDAEVQTIRCKDKVVDGDESIIFTFRQASTIALGPQSTVAELEAALEALDSISGVELETNGDDDDDSLSNICGSTSGTTTGVTVTFTGVQGDVPLLTAEHSGIDSGFTITETVKGTTEYLECSNRGLCNTATGRCECFDGFSASDGNGNQGIIADCGYANPFPIHEE